MSIYTFKDLLAFDFETANMQRHPCSIGWAHLTHSPEANPAVFEQLINPESFFDPKSVRVHGIQEHEVLDAPYWPEALEAFAEKISPATLLLAHNAKFDVNVILKACERYNIEVPDFHYLCTYQLAKSFFDIPRCGLSNLGAHLGFKFSHHRASDDALACLEVYKHIEREVIQTGITLEDFLAQHQITLGSVVNNLHTPFKGGSIVYKLPEPTDTTVFANNTFCFAGDLKHFNNKQAEQIVRARGGEIKKRVSKTLDFFIVGEPGFWTTEEDFALRVARAQELALESPTLQVLTETEWLATLNKVL